MAENSAELSAEGQLPRKKKVFDKERNKTRINISLAFLRYRALQAAKGIQFD